MHTLQLSIFQSSIKIYCFFLLLLLPICYRKVSLSRLFVLLQFQCIEPAREWKFIIS